jgi:outer membrane receptor protein involved in Fe transport
MDISWQSFRKSAARRGTLMLFATLALLLVCMPAPAQVTASSSLEGTIMDIKQAVIPGATVAVTNNATGLNRSVQTNESGAYRFDLLPAGFYDIKVSAAGFGDVTSPKVELLVGKTSTIDFTLSPGGRTETVTVTSDAPLLDQQKTDVGQNITPREVEDLPLNGRDLGNLAYLAPGAQPVDSYDPTKNRIAIFGINGSSGRNVNVTVNGIDNKDNTVGGPVMQFALEAIQEFIISTQRFSAANGRSEGAAVNVITKSGGNKFHGSGFFFERDKKLNANDFLTKQGGGEKPPFSRQQFGGSIGGPIRHDKTFFFFALERQREETSFPADPDAVAELTLVQSLGAQPSAVIPTPYRDTRWNARVDHRFSDNHNAFVSYNYQTNRGLNDQSNATSDLTAGNFTTNKLILANATLNSILTPKVTNSFTVGYQYWNNIIDTQKLSQTFFFPGGITFGTNVNVPQQSYQAKYQFKDDISFIRGNHSFKTGVDYVWEPKLGGFFKFNATLETDFLDLPSVILSHPLKCGPNKNQDCYPQGFATPGAVIAMTATSGDPYFNLQGGAKMLGFYFQDDWKATHRLTLNLGLRWDRDFNLVGADTQLRNRTYLALKTIGHPAAASLPKDDNKDFSPRVGFAYDLRGNGKHVLRGGYGLYYGQVFLNIPLFMLQQANPTIFASAFSISSAGPGDIRADIVPGTGIQLSNWRFGIDPNPTIPPPQTKFLGGETGRIMDPNYHNPFTQQWNLGYAYQLNRNSVIEIEYVHTIGLRESKTLNINPRIPPTTVRVLDARFVAAGLPKLGRIDLEASVGRSRYDALNLSYRRRLSNHFSLNASYRLSKALAYNGASAAFRNRAVDPNNVFRPLDFGPTPNDERHRVVASGVFELPWDIQIAPIMQMASARPYTAIQGIDVYGFGSGVGSVHAIVLTSNPHNLTATKDFTVAQLQNCLAIGQCFETPFDDVRGQPFFQLDTRVSKNFKFGEDKKLTVLFQMFDLTNRANFGNTFTTNIRSSSFGQPNGFITPSGVIVPHSFSGELGVRFTF